MLTFLSACAPAMNNAEMGTRIGAGGGAVFGALAGQLIGGDTKSTVVGAAIGTIVGTAAGAGIGDYMDRQEKEMRQALAESEAVSIQREQENLAMTFKSDLLFSIDSASPSSAATKEIKRVASVLSNYPETKIIINGHTDSTGSPVYNQKLSELRAMAVKYVLVDAGISEARVETNGYGEISPVAPNDTQEGRQLNRRVEIKLIPPRA